MKLKEIKPGMAIHCKTEDEYKKLGEEAQKLGFGQLPIRFNEDSFISDYVYVITEDGIFWSDVTCREYIEFSDLIIPQLTAEEVLSAISEMCRNKSCKECYLGAYCDHTNSTCSIQLMEPDVVIDACIKWKSDHEKKGPEIEKYDAVRVVECSDGAEKVVYEEPVPEDFDYEQESVDDFVEETLLNYCKEHKGTYEAYMAHFCRVKAVE